MSRFRKENVAADGERGDAGGAGVRVVRVNGAAADVCGAGRDYAGDGGNHAARSARGESAVARGDMKGETEENIRACADFPERHVKCPFWAWFVGFGARAVIHQQLFKFSIKTGGRRSEAPLNPTTVQTQISHIFSFPPR
mmetsp:Transcript_17398/g.48053  ORF Transcript_17398/g.48053 Transcript_17398/m.48053 type:complete len:140 (-) Transcript_17398:593-1012(-)